MEEARVGTERLRAALPTEDCIPGFAPRRLAPRLCLCRPVCVGRFPRVRPPLCRLEAREAGRPWLGSTAARHDHHILERRRTVLLVLLVLVLVELIQVGRRSVGPLAAAAALGPLLGALIEQLAAPQVRESAAEWTDRVGRRRWGQIASLRELYPEGGHRAAKLLVALLYGGHEKRDHRAIEELNAFMLADLESIYVRAVCRRVL